MQSEIVYEWLKIKSIFEDEGNKSSQYVQPEKKTMFKMNCLTHNEGSLHLILQPHSQNFGTIRKMVIKQVICKFYSPCTILKTLQQHII